MGIKQYSIFLASSFELHTEREKFGNFINSENKRLQAKNVFLRLEVWEDMDDAFNTTCKQEDYNEYLAKCEICVVLFWTKVGKYTLHEYELARKLSLENKLRLYVYEKNAKPDQEPKQTDKESKERFLSLLQKDSMEQFQGQFETYSELENRFRKTLDGLFDTGVLTYGERAKMLSPNGPILPNPFLGREKELKTLEERFAKIPQTLHIHAEGGMGKTTLASKYWYESEYRYSHHAWLFCEQGIMDALKSLAPNLGLDPAAFNQLKEEEKVTSLKTTISKLEGDFLLVLDNANDAELIKEFLKQFRGFKWNVLITSRCREVMDFSENELLLDHLSADEARALFLEYYRENSGEFDNLLDRFLEGLNYHTLLIEVFAKNLKEASELGIDLKGFIEELETKGLILEDDNNFEIKSSYLGNVDKKAATTNDILEILYDFTKLTEEERLFLVNMALIPSETYTLEFLLELFEPENKRAFRDNLKNLYRKGWLGGADEGDKPIYRLSPVIQSLVQTKNRETLWEDGHHLFTTLRKLLQYEPEKDNTHTKFKWIPYGRHLANSFVTIPHSDFIHFLDELRKVLILKGGINSLLESKSIIERVLNSDFFASGVDAPVATYWFSNLALTLSELGGKDNLKGAKDYFEKSLQINSTYLGESNPQIIADKYHLAIVLKKIGGKDNLLNAKSHLELVLESDILNYGEISGNTATTRSTLAMVLLELGGEDNVHQAKIHSQIALKTDIQLFGENAPNTTRERSNYTVVLQTIGGNENLLEAKKNIEIALALDISNFGENSKEAASSHLNLSIFLNNLGGYDNLTNAKIHSERALSLAILNFGEDSPLIIDYRINLTKIYRLIGGENNFREAHRILSESYDHAIKKFGDQSIQIASILFELGILYSYVGKTTQGKNLLENCLAIYRKHFDEDYFKIIEIQQWLEWVDKRLRKT
ncbi:tetratricopeptide repeat protein [Algoriphagus antarcticus]|uniref:NB-ARC domain-containing protein n=1 Tax=Algoriphagus antarcticus TaxID=238540 RepID=A0A3E0DVR2_9BACT|nr:tetratricopeptide repeat protein [Algoriphagus antarcticus]REG88697.1 NB-ARC domain-containing protein [Algoriphagus antarcticus]